MARVHRCRPCMRRYSAMCISRPGSRLPLDAGHEERAIYVIDGVVDISGDKFEAGRLLVFKPGDQRDNPAHRPIRISSSRRRTDGWPAAHLVEFRFVPQGPHRAGQGRTGKPAISAKCRATRSSSSRCRTSDADHAWISPPLFPTLRRAAPHRVAILRRSCRSGSKRPLSETGLVPRPTSLEFRGSDRSYR